MNNIDEFVNATNRMLDEEQRKYNEAANEKALYAELKEEAAKKEKASRATIKELELAKLHAEKAQGIYTTSDNSTNHSTKEEVVYVEEKTETVKKSNSGAKGIVNLIVAAALLVGGAYGYKLYKESKTGDVRVATASIGTTDSVKINPENNETNSDVTYNYDSNEVVVVDNNASEKETNTSNEQAVVEVKDETLTTENFESLVANYANKYSSQYSIVETSDITKFAVIANIDILAEENPELIRQVAGDKTKEEFLNDAAKLIGLTDMYNSNVWEQTKSTDDFIRLSDVVYGDQKQKMLKVEAYIDAIADAVNAEDADLVNSIISEFILDLNSGELSKLDDGVGFVMASYLLTMSDSIAKDYLNQQNFDMLQVLKTSEKYVSNIFTVYDRCTEDTKTRTR